MARHLSEDLRIGVIRAVEGGMSRNAAARTVDALEAAIAAALDALTPQECANDFTNSGYELN